MSFSLHKSSVILFLPCWSFQSPRQNCRGLVKRVLSQRCIIREGRRSAGSQKPLPSHRPSLPSLPWWHPWGSGRLGGYHIFTWMNCTLQLLLCTRNPKVLTLKIKFFSFQLFQPLFFKGDLFFMAGLGTCVYLFTEEVSHGVAVVFLRQSLASQESQVGIGAFWLNIFNLKNPCTPGNSLGYIYGQQIQSRRQMVLRFVA